MNTKYSSLTYRNYIVLDWPFSSLIGIFKEWQCEVLLHMISVWQCYLHGVAWYGNVMCNGMEMAWQWYGNCIAMIWQWYDNGMTMVWQQNGNGMAMALQWYDNCMAMLCTDGTIIAVFAIRKLGRFPRNQFTNRRRSVYLFCFIIVFSSISLVTPAVEG